MKSKHKTSHATQSTTIGITCGHAEIALCAHAIWEQEGRPEGRDTSNWLEAEAQLRSGSPTQDKPGK